jgi:hypothetical protein
MDDFAPNPHPNVISQVTPRMPTIWEPLTTFSQPFTRLHAFSGQLCAYLSGPTIYERMWPKFNIHIRTTDNDSSKAFFNITNLSLLICHTVSFGKQNSWTAWPRRRKHSGSSKRRELFKPTTQLNNPENLNLRQHGWRNLTSRIFYIAGSVECL